MEYEICFINYFSEDEKQKATKFIDDNFNDLELHQGYNYSIDVSDAIHRTANVDIEIF